MKLLLPLLVLLLAGCYVPGQKHEPEVGPFTTEESSWIWLHDIPPAVYFTAAPDPAMSCRVRVTNNGGTILQPGTVEVAVDGVTTAYPVKRLAYMESDYITVQFWNAADETRDIPVSVVYVAGSGG
jgi:hypothetical protein